MKVAIAGAGSVGRSIARELLSKRHAVLLIDKDTRAYCTCVAPVFARHMTPDSRQRLAVENRTDVRPQYDDDKATFDDVVKACPPSK